MLKHFRKIVGIVFLCVINFSVLATIYQWKDANGNVVFSDRPHSNATTVDLNSLQTYQSPTVDPTKSIENKPVNDAYYQQLIFSSLKDKQTIRNNNAVPLTVDVQINPALRKTDQVSLLLDGKVLQHKKDPNATSISFILLDVPRGEHSLQARIETIDGNKILLASESLTLYFLQTTVNTAATS